METIIKNIWDSMDISNKNNINDILAQSYKLPSIPNKIKFKILDLQDIIKNIAIFFLPRNLLPCMNTNIVGKK